MVWRARLQRACAPCDKAEIRWQLQKIETDITLLNEIVI